MSDLPEFDRTRNPDFVRSFARRVLSHGNESYLHDVIVYEDGHFRATFDPAYFVLAEGKTEPSRSQWNTLKKHIKRMDHSVFVFKQYGYTDSGDAYLDFGFFRD